MKHPVTPLVAAATLFAAAFFWRIDASAAEPAVLVVELFTSQGCNSCPPADELLGELARRSDVLPLSFHVTYWDRLGWPDTFGLEDGTRRQELYAKWLGLSRVYTPQMVIGGRIDVVGSARGRVLDAIELLRDHAPAGPELTVTGDRLSIGPGEQADAAEEAARRVYWDMAIYDKESMELLIKRVGADNVLFATEMFGAVNAIDPKTGRNFEDLVPIFQEIEWLTAEDRYKISEGNAKKVFSRMLKQKG